MQGYRKVLVGVDGSKQSSLAFKRAVNVAKQYNATLIIASVLNGDKYVGIGTAVDAFHVNQVFENDLLDNMREQAESLADEARTTGVADVIIDVGIGNVKTKLSEELVEKYDVDLIVVGATGTNVIERMLIGSTTNFVLQHAPVDVVVVRK